MQKFDVLSRGSLFLVPSKKKKFRLVSAQHILFPFYYPKLYDLVNQYNWLTFVREEHTYSVLQLRNAVGDITDEFRLHPGVHKHESLDLAVMDLSAREERRFLDTISEGREDFDLSDYILNLSPDSFPSEVDFHGFTLTRNAAGLEVLVPHVMRGETVPISSGTRYFLRTSEPSPFGMCGGPAVHPLTGECVGMVEGLVSSVPDQQYELVQNATVAISAKEISDFLKSIEE